MSPISSINIFILCGLMVVGVFAVLVLFVLGVIWCGNSTACLPGL
jgi:hypothetical protein